MAARAASCDQSFAVHACICYDHMYLFCEFFVISMHIRWKSNDDKILTWNHPFSKDTLIGMNGRAVIYLQAVGAVNVKLTGQAPRQWVVCRHGAGLPEPGYLS